MQIGHGRVNFFGVIWGGNDQLVNFALPTYVTINFIEKTWIFEVFFISWWLEDLQEKFYATWYFENYNTFSYKFVY